jgi:hypothetical protein
MASNARDVYLNVYDLNEQTNSWLGGVGFGNTLAYVFLGLTCLA